MSSSKFTSQNKLVRNRRQIKWIFQGLLQKQEEPQMKKDNAPTQLVTIQAIRLNFKGM